LREEAEELERKRIQQMEEGFDREGSLRALGGKCTDFEVEDATRRTQHYDWLLPIYFRPIESEGEGQQIQKK